MESGEPPTSTYPKPTVLCGYPNAKGCTRNHHSSEERKGCHHSKKKSLFGKENPPSKVCLKRRKTGQWPLTGSEKDGYQLQSRGKYSWVSYRGHREITAWIGEMVAAKTHGKWRATYTKLIPNQRYCVAIHMPRAAPEPSLLRRKERMPSLEKKSGKYAAKKQGYGSNNVWNTKPRHSTSR